MDLIYDSNLQKNYATITPIKCNFTDTNESTRLYVELTMDNLVSVAVFKYQLMDDNLNVYYTDTMAITGIDYTNWTGDNTTPFVFIKTKLGL